METPSKTLFFTGFYFFPQREPRDLGTASLSPGPDPSIELNPEPDPDFC
jgi:hypothetical protein